MAVDRRRCLADRERRRSTSTSTGQVSAEPTLDHPHGRQPQQKVVALVLDQLNEAAGFRARMGAGLPAVAVDVQHSPAQALGSACKPASKCNDAHNLLAGTPLHHHRGGGSHAHQHVFHAPQHILGRQRSTVLRRV